MEKINVKVDKEFVCEMVKTNSKVNFLINGQIVFNVHNDGDYIIEKNTLKDLGFKEYK